MNLFVKVCTYTIKMICGFLFCFVGINEAIYGQPKTQKFIRIHYGTINLLFRTLCDYDGYNKAMAFDLKSKHAIFGVVNELCSLWGNYTDQIKYFVNLKALVKTEQNNERISLALNMLGLCYVKGICVEKDLIESIKYQELAFVRDPSGNSNIFAAIDLGHHYWNNEEYEKGIWYLLKASEKFAKVAIWKLEMIVASSGSYVKLTSHNKEFILNLFMELSKDDNVTYNFV